MAVTISLYDSAAASLFGQTVHLDALKVMNLNDDAAFDATHVTLAGPAGAANANEVAGNGWPTGGELLTGVAVTTVTTNDAKLDADDIVVLASGGPISGVFKSVIYDDDDASDKPLAFIDWGEELSAGEGTDFKIFWSSNGIVTVSYTLP